MSENKKTILSSILALFMVLNLSGCNLSEKLNFDADDELTLEDTLLRENKQLEGRIADLETKISELETTKIELQKLIYEGKDFYSQDELRCVEVMDNEGKSTFKIVALIRGNIDAVDKQPHIDYFNSVYEEGPNFRVTDGTIDYFYDIKTKEIIGSDLHLKLQNCPDEEITPVTGANYIHISLGNQTKTIVEYVESLTVDFSNRQVSEGIDNIIVEYLSQNHTEGESKDTWTIDEIGELEERLNSLTPRERFLRFEPWADHFLNS